VQELKKEVEGLTAQLKEHAAELQKVRTQLAVGERVTSVVLKRP
jgi:ribosomal protein L29